MSADWLSDFLHRLSAAALLTTKASDYATNAPEAKVARRLPDIVHSQLGEFIQQKLAPTHPKEATHARTSLVSCLTG